MNTTQSLSILHRDDLPLGGFAGLKEHRLVQDSKAWGHHRSADAWDGLGNFVYLADARFIPHGETGMHPHHEIDVISVMVEGRIAHGGSLNDGSIVAAPEVQVQRAGGDGFRHNEVNPDDVTNRMIQMWVLPESPGQPADYRSYTPEQGHTTRIYGGSSNQTDTLPARTTIDVAMPDQGQSLHLEGDFLVYVTRGHGTAGEINITDGDLLRGSGMTIKATTDMQLIVVQLLK